MSIGDAIVPLLTLTGMEIVLGIDNVIFIAIVAARLPASQQSLARQLGLGLALITRLMLLFVLSFLLGLDKTVVFNLSDFGIPESWFTKPEANYVSWRDIILFTGGMFLIAKSTYEIHEKLEGAGEHEAAGTGRHAGFGMTLVQIAILDIVFSLDSVITAVGMAQEVWIMVVAMVISVIVMLIFAGPISNFVHRHPTLKILALSFLILIGVMLVAEAVDQHIDRSLIYFAMAFSLVVELLNLKLRKASEPVKLHEPPPPPEMAGSPAH